MEDSNCKYFDSYSKDIKNIKGVYMLTVSYWGNSIMEIRHQSWRFDNDLEILANWRQNGLLGKQLSLPDFCFVKSEVWVGGESWVVTEELIYNLVEFVYLLYGKRMDSKRIELNTERKLQKQKLPKVYKVCWYSFKRQITGFLAGFDDITIEVMWLNSLK